MNATGGKQLLPLSGADEATTESNSLNLLLFSVGGVSYGIDAEQVSEIADYEEEQTEGLFWFHEEIGYGDKTVSYSSPVIITIKSEAASTYRVIIDSMEDITAFAHDELTLFPALLEPFVLPRGFWGVLPRSGSMVLLLDFKRLLRERNCC